MPWPSPGANPTFRQERVSAPDAQVSKTAMMKRVTITMDEKTYLKLLEYALERSKAELRNVSVSEAVRELLEMQMKRKRITSVKGVKRSR